jgi:hypothetical protein
MARAGRRLYPSRMRRRWLVIVLGVVGGGAGGISVGVAYTDKAPDVDAATLAGMSLGPAGKGGAGPVNNPGIDGISQVIFEATALYE